ncbi:MAG TPA: thiazole biosynthesis protein [candidate division WOR-3 bacterium]|uniref:Thiamine thiazole synthase n=1 Tax=candidate division WOR-3 bacterium TaxID=2052148 RepID=A0A7V0XFT4_UNCW3|nr:thiazole biosynthesis protein [candidate division WOR-3 bacterium]
MQLNDVEISRAIIERFTHRLLDNFEVDAAIVGAGPAGLTAAFSLAEKGIRTVVFERSLRPGGGMPGGGMMFSEIVVPQDAGRLLENCGVDLHEQRPGYFVADSLQVLGALLLRTTRAGVKIFNLVSAEDVLLIEDRIRGLVLNWSAVELAGLHVDPLTMTARAVVDATGHPAEVVKNLVRKARVKLNTPSGAFEGERPMWADRAEKLTLDNTGEVYPGLWVAGMCANAVHGGPRMGPIFGGMFLSGVRVAELIAASLRRTPER